MSSHAPLRRFADHGRDYAFGIFRIVVSLLFLLHGVSKLSGTMGMPEPAQLGSMPWWAGAIELVTGVLMLVGWGTRSAALLASGTMAFAYFAAHQPTGLLPIQNGGELAAIYAWAFLLLAFTGPGALSLESVFRRAPADSNDPVPATA